ncbi:MAG: serine/threonine protein kinase [Phycisphaerales bacterium]|nr:serine/threonine protein kinase [Phycisphaerales bacterium]
MSTANEEARLLASTLPSDLMPTATWRPPNVGDLFVRKISGSKPPEITLQEQERIDSEPVELLVGELIGTGGMGMVHAAEQMSLNREVAIKRVRPDRLHDGSDAQLQREACLMGQLEHPAIPPLHMVATADNQCVLVMRRVRGIPWDQKLEDYDLESTGNILQGAPLRTELGILIRIGEAIAFGHGHRILHRDIKPSNVVIGDFGEVYVLDWGISVELDENGVYESPAFSGTPSFAAPEMIGRKPILDERTDVYQLGATLYHIVTGGPPHQGTTAEEVFNKILISPGPEISDAWPSSLAEVCRKALAPDPSDRYFSVRAMLEDLRYVIEYGELTDLEVECDQNLTKLEEMAQHRHVDTATFDEVAAHCRYGLERILESWPGNIGVSQKLARCLFLLCETTIGRQNLTAARANLAEYRRVGGEDVQRRADTMAKRIDALADQLIARTDELGVNIQVRLVEKLAQQQQELEQLQKAYDEIRGGKQPPSA